MPCQTTQGPAGVHSPANLFSPGVLVLLVLLIAGFLLRSLSGQFVASLLLLHPHDVVTGSVWQLLTYSFFNCGRSLVFYILAILFIGSAVEREWQTRALLMLWIVVAVVCGILWTMTSLIMGREMIGSSSSACIYGLVAAFGLLFRGRRFMFFAGSVSGYQLALIMVGIGAVMAIGQPMSLIWVSGAGVAYLYIKLQWRIMRGQRESQTVKRDSLVDID
jgi:membrane associated rhomboid family serine protease